MCGGSDSAITVQDTSSSTSSSTSTTLLDENIKKAQDIINKFTIVQDNSYTDFTTYVDVGPLRVFKLREVKLQEASDTFY